MKNFFSKNLLKKIVLITALFLTIGLGLYFRIGGNNDKTVFKTHNIISYYYDIAARFNADLIWPQEDVWHFAPERAVENVPPILAYLTVYTYRAIHFFMPNLVFDEWLFGLPVAFFLIWAAAGFYLIKRMSGSFYFSVLFLILLALIPSSITLTEFGHYTEEFMGSFWLFLSFIFLVIWRKEHRKIFLAGSLIFTALLILTWQQFHIIFVIYGFSAILSLAKGRIKEAVDIFILSSAAILTAEIFSLYFLHSAYRPSQMIYESYLGLTSYKSDFLRLAMSRTDWGNLSFARAINYFGIWGSLVWLVGMGRLALDSRKNRENMYLLFANTIALMLIFFFVKSVFVFLPFFLIVATYGGKWLIEIMLNSKNDLKRIS